MKLEICLEQVSASLAAAAEQVLETMFFTTIDGPLDCAPEPAEEIVSAALPFRGDFSGIFRLDLSLTSARRMTADFLADEPDELSPARIGETVCELANMICGSALSHTVGENIFELLCPHLNEAENGTLPSGANSAVRIFQLEDGFLRLSLEVQ